MWIVAAFSDGVRPAKKPRSRIQEEKEEETWQEPQLECLCMIPVSKVDQVRVVHGIFGLFFLN